MSQSYQDKNDIKNILALRKVIDTLPSFSKDYFRSLETTTTTKTRLSYGYDLRLFFYFMCQHNPIFRDKTIEKITLEDMERIVAVDIEEYMEFLKYYTDAQGRTHTNKEAGVARKLSCLRSFYTYYQKHERLKTNPLLIIDQPKHRQHNIIRLDINEVADVLDYVEFGGKNLTGKKKTFWKKNRLRNLAIFTLLLGTGIRVSECVGLDLTDIDFNNNRLQIIRKGQKEDFVYFGDEVASALSDYLAVRNKIQPVEGHENALFLSLQRRRMCVRSVEHMVTDYASSTTTKHITPHKLRSTFGTSLYRETGDIYLVAEVLGHNDVNTTKKHYAALDEDRKRKASNVIKLRKND